MIGYILLIVLTIGSWMLFRYGYKHDKDAPAVAGLFLGIIFLLLLVASTMWLAFRSDEADELKKDRDYRQELVNAISEDMSPATIAEIFSSAEYVNRRIEKQKKRCNSVMWGFMYSEEMAEVEPIEIPKYKISVEIEE